MHGFLLMAAAAVLLAAVEAGCAGGNTSKLRVLNVSEKDFRIKAGRDVRAGELRLRVHNNGPDTHELLLVRAGHGALPLRSDGLTVDEDAVEHATVATVEALEPGGGGEVNVHLAPGRYVLFCNMAGHYLSGMRTTVIAQ